MLAAVGAEAEAQLPLAGLHQLLRRVQASVAGLPVGQRTGCVPQSVIRQEQRDISR
jgi:hypothetical protein